jgi:MFS family permease
MKGLATDRLFGSRAFSRLWAAQVVSSLGDWIGFIAVTAIAARIGGSTPAAAVGFVLSARLIPGFFLGSVAGVLVDRWDRRRVMVTCDIGRGLVLAVLPFARNVFQLFAASLVLELLTLLWAPAKEASVPNIVPREFLPNANSLSLAAAYGTFPISSAVFALLVNVAGHVGRAPETVALFFDVGTFFLSATLIATLALPRRQRAANGEARIDFHQTINDLKDGWRFIGQNPVVRSVIVGLATGLIGGGMVVPLGPVFAKVILGSGSAGFGLLLTALGTGVAAGVIAVSVVQKRLPQERIFVRVLAAAGGCLAIAASTSHLIIAVLFVGGLGLCAGAVYVLGFTILQSNVEDELRGRTFATLYTLIRFCLLLAFAVAPFLSTLLDGLSSRIFGGRAVLFRWGILLPGVRLTLWLGGIVILGAGLLAAGALRPRTRS